MNALYCRNCGAAVRLEQSAEQLFWDFGGAPATDDCIYGLVGPIQPKRIVSKPGMPVPKLECACGAKGPFGNAGQITDEKPGEICLACKDATLEAEGHWIT